MIIWNHTHLTMCRAKSTECQNWIKNQFDVFRFKAHFKNNRFGCEMGKIHNRKIGQQLVGFDCNSSKNIFPQSIIVFRLFSVFAFFCWNVIKIGCKRFHDWFFSISIFSVLAFRWVKYFKSTDYFEQNPTSLWVYPSWKLNSELVGNVTNVTLSQLNSLKCVSCYANTHELIVQSYGPLMIIWLYPFQAAPMTQWLIVNNIT